METDYYEDTDTYEPPVPVRRASRTSALPVRRQTEPVPVISKPRRSHPLLPFGIGMFIVVVAVLLFQQVLVPVTNAASDQWHYGDARITQLDADVGHGGTSRFIAEAERGAVIVLELPLADISKSRYYAVTGLVATGTPVIKLAVIDVNRDSKPDLVISVEGTAVQLVLYNTGNAFKD